MLLEICASSIDSVINAQNGGAGRIELCSALLVGGLTPSYGLIKQAVEFSSIPIFALIRPKGGNFVYTQNELAIMQTDIEMCKVLGCSGIVSGALKSNGSIDIGVTKQLMAWSRPLEFTFHRAFDHTPDARKALDELMELGVNRILSSGQASTAKKGFDLLVKLKDIADGQLTILPGGSIRPDNIDSFIKAGFSEIHSSAAAASDDGLFTSDLETIHEMMSKIKAYNYG